MDYTPRFSQPFSFAEAVNLDVPVITEEIARLQNSLVHLKETQELLEAELNASTECDPEISKAFEENKVIIGSQEERISMLRMALTDKGITSGSHYDIPITLLSLPVGRIAHVEQTDTQAAQTIPENQNEAGGGVFL